MHKWCALFHLPPYSSVTQSVICRKCLREKKLAFVKPLYNRIFLTLANNVHCGLGWVRIPPKQSMMHTIKDACTQTGLECTMNVHTSYIPVELILADCINKSKVEEPKYDCYDLNRKYIGIWMKPTWICFAILPPCKKSLNLRTNRQNSFRTINYAKNVN